MVERYNGLASDVNGARCQCARRPVRRPRLDSEADTTGATNREAFPSDPAPSNVGRDRGEIYGQDFAGMIKGMGMQDVLKRSPREPTHYHC